MYQTDSFHPVNNNSPKEKADKNNDLIHIFSASAFPFIIKLS